MKIKDVQLTNFNPRYTKIEPDFNMKTLIDNNEGYDEIKIAKNLLEYELMNMSFFIELLESLSEGYNKKIDKPFMVKSDSNFIVVEGNRRILALKMLNKNIAVENVIPKENKSYSKVIKVIEDYRENKNEFVEDEYELIEENEDLWPSIYTRHISNARGKRSWNRLKYLFDLVIFYKNEIAIKSKDPYKGCERRFNRSVSIIKNDLKSGFFVYQLIERYNAQNPDNKVEPFKDDAGKGRGIKASALEPNNLINIKINKTPLLQYLGIERGEDSIFSVNENKKEAEGNYTFDDFAVFLIDSYFAKNFTTRGWKPDKLSILKKFADGFGKKMPSGMFDTLADVMPRKGDEINTTKQKEELELDIESSADSNDDIDVIASIEKQNQSNLSEMSDAIKKMAKTMKKIEFPNTNCHLEAIRIATYFIISLDLDNYQMNLIPFHAIATSIRTIYEHIIYYLVEELGENHAYVNFISSKSFEKIHTEDAYSIFSKFNGKFKDATNDEYETLIEKFVLNLKEAKKSTSTDTLLKDIILNDGSSHPAALFKKDWLDAVNESIHSMSTIIKHSKNEDAIRFLKLQIDLASLIVDELIS